MKKTPSETVIRAWARLVRAQQAAMTTIETALKAAKLPPLSWYDALLELERAGEEGLRPFELEREMLLPQYSLSRLVDRIEREGYLARSPCADDGRGQVIVITKAGRDLRRRMWPIYAAAIQQAIAAHISDDEAVVLDKLLGKLLRQGRA
jgi:DNA-binding MarR family transcriptional regulator